MTKSKLLGLLVLLAFIVASLLVYFEYQTSQDEIEKQFVDARNYIAEGTLSNLRGKVDTEYSYLFTDCENRSEYNSLIDSDSRALSAVELKRALNLHKECGHLFSNKNRFIIDLLKNNLSRLESYAMLFGTGENARNAKETVKYWQKIYDKEREGVIIYDRLVDIQEEYWIKDLNKSIGVITSEGREASVGALNFEATQKLKDAKVISEEVKELRRIENLFWDKSFEKEPQKN